MTIIIDNLYYIHEVSMVYVWCIYRTCYPLSSF
jgi:hypothetical protein